MKKTIHLLLLAVISSISFISCGPKCKQCESQIMGQKSGISVEMCDQELKRAEATGIFICK